MAHAQSLDQVSVTQLKGVGDSLAQTLLKLNISSVQDLLFHLPLRYLDRTRITPIAKLRLNTSAVVQANVIHHTVAFGKRRSLAVKIEDATGAITLRFFHFNASQKNQFVEGAVLRCYGEPRLGSNGMEFYHPEYEFVREGQDSKIEQALTPVYALTEGISQLRLRKIIEAALALSQRYSIEELLTQEAHPSFVNASLAQALQYLHAPPKDAPVEQLLEGTHEFQQRLAFEELLAHFLASQQSKLQLQQHKCPLIKTDNTLAKKFIAQLPFTPTSAQQRVCEEIAEDFKANKPMLRMIQGDVGSGKTLVAALATIHVINSGYQVALVAPTEILAEQHFHNFSSWLATFDIEVSWLVGKLSAKKRRDVLESITNGTSRVVIGTHAIFQEDVHFFKLGLAIIDEQHRFGVGQRLSLRKPNKDNEIPHQLVMTATPIPRTLAMTAYADLDYSIIDELPPGRTPVNTALISQKRREAVIERIDVACRNQQQVYWVCPLVEESENLAVANAEATATNLREHLPGISIGLIHGRLKADEKEKQMLAFKQDHTKLLVATTVIEVGVDVPNANLMIIENPERLGLAQLHQLRGRVGRGKTQSHCILLYGDKLSEHAKQRLQVLRETTDGFAIAEQDLLLRGPGELLGTRQTGDISYRLANIQRHAHLLESVHNIGKTLINSDPKKVNTLIKRWVGNNQEYANV